MGDEEPSSLVVEQRIRNRIIDYLEAVVAFERDPPWDLGEMINQWEDWVEHPLDPARFSPPVYTAREAEALVGVDRAWGGFCDATPWSMGDEASALAMPQWGELVGAAAAALRILGERDRLPEDADCEQSP